MTLSVLIVNYNVCYFLEHCLLSVERAVAQMKVTMPGSAVEILVIDNDSSDGSLAYLTERFPSVIFMSAGANVGFARANNYALAQAQGQYILFLNPDTIIPEDCLWKTIAYLDKHDDAGACGVRMIDGAGQYLPESKRGFPGSWNSFCKMTGLTDMFPGSGIFAGYYEGSLDAGKTQPVAILSGAFMLVKAAVLKKVGSFDERFFMYAEDIDLSYRIAKAGFRNIYFAETTILHFKGESTMKDGEYVKRFYTAMILFVQKHFPGYRAKVYEKLLQVVIKLKSSKQPESKTSIPFSVAPAATYLTGDSHSIQSLKGKLYDKSDSVSADKTGRRNSVMARVLTNDKTVANEIIYCIGDGYPQIRVIESMETDPNVSKRIFDPGAGSIIGSDSKEERGSIEVF